MRALPPLRSLAWLAIASSVTLVAMAGPAHAANSPSPSPSASPSAAATGSSEPPVTTESATPGATPLPGASGEATASAAATPTPTPSPGSTTGSTIDLGNTDLTVGIDRFISYPATATAVGSRGLASVTLAIPKGMVPIVLNGTLTSVADSPGLVRIRVGTSYVELDAVTGGRFSLELGLDAAVDDNVTVEVRNTLDLGQGECVSDTTTTETVSDLQLGFLGKETPPTTVAGFFSPPVQRVTLVVPSETSPEVAEAALAGAGALAARYDQLVPIVVTTPEQFDVDPRRYDNAKGPFRIVRIEPSDEPTSTVVISDPGVPTMTISGPSASLAAATSALSEVELGLAAVPVATELSDIQKTYSVPTLTLSQLGAEKPTLSGLGRIEYAIPVGQSSFGGPISSVDIHLEGTHTPVANNGAMVASVLWNGTLVESQTLGQDTDVYLADTSVPAGLIQRDNTLTIRLDASPPGGNCQSGAPVIAQLDLFSTVSTITATPGQSLGVGFVRFPQAFGETMRVAFGSGELTPDLVRTGAAMVASLQRATGQRLNIDVIPFSEAVGAPYAVMVIGATPDDANTLKAPLRFEPWRALDDARSTFSVTVDGPFAALEAFESAGQNILMLGSTAPTAQAQPLMDQIADEAQNGTFGWFGIGGSILVAQPGAQPLELQLRTLVPQESVQRDEASLPVWLFALIALLVVVILVRFVWLRRRKRRISRTLAEAEQSALDEREPDGPPLP